MVLMSFETIYPCAVYQQKQNKRGTISVRNGGFRICNILKSKIYGNALFISKMNTVKLTQVVNTQEPTPPNAN